MRRFFGATFILSALGLASCSHILRSSGGSGEIHGNVTDSAGTHPIAGASVWLMGTKIGALTDDSGQYNIKKVVPGSYRFSFSSVGYVTKEVQPVQVRSDTRTQLNIDLVARDPSDTNFVIETFDPPGPPFGVVKGLVVDSITRQPVMGASVMLAGTSARAMTDEKGKFEICPAFPGVYTLVVSAGGLWAKSVGSVRVEADKKTNLRLTLFQNLQ